MEHKISKEKNKDRIESSQKIKESLNDELNEVIKNLFYTSETDEPFETFVWKRETGTAAFSEVSASCVLRFVQKPPETPVRVQTLEDFFRFPTIEQDWHGDEEKEVVQRYRKLKELLEQNLRDAKVFKIGEIEIDVYLVGIDANGDLAGVKTKAVET